ncbi:hypothetical protein [Undibacterium rugosum]|uniref:hypothetical protein n=1 Tax=Undibacterium rugosum TaxID=2762291 RepID=UPI001B82DF24|nr:hypothetical protein [Undibacterium rugosum]MBR7777942.1 hypothetical protein [Undibacterium rugosum]
MDFSKKSFNNNHLPSIFAFPKDVNFWRIDWFGEVAFPNRLLRRTQPSVLVHLSRVLNPSFQENPALLLGPASTFASRQRKVWVSVGTLPLLRVGDIWQHGQLTYAPDYELEQFFDLDINSQTAVLIKAGLNLEDKGFLLPRTEHPWHMECTQSYCLMVELPQNRRLIIPCMELIRFYFGSSSNLLTKLFLPPLVRDMLYSKPHFDKASGRLTLQLAVGISGVSAADIGRMHMDPHAWRAALHVGTSLLKGSVSGQGPYPQAYFPFEGQTDLIASGKWLSFQYDPRATFIVYSLRSCSYPFPFRSLRYDVKDRSQSPVKKNDQKQNEPEARIARKSAGDSPNQQLTETDASNNLAKQQQPAWGSARFPDLTLKTIWKNRTLSEPSANNAFDGTQPSDIQHSAVGDPGSERRVRPIDFEIRAKQKSEFPVPEFLCEIVGELEALDGFNIQLLTDSEQDGWTIPINVLVSEDGEIDARLFIEMGENQLRERRVTVFTVEYEAECIKIVAIESSPTHMKLYLPSNDDETDLLKTLSCSATDFISRPEPKSEDIAHLIRWVFNLV